MAVTTIADLVGLLGQTPGRPRITWYALDGERVELSGAVLGNWVSKTTNLLVEEFDAGPGTRVLLDLPGHWRTVVWALAAWRCGACVVVDPTEAADVTVTERPAAHPDGDAVVAVALPALARAFPGGPPPGAIDAAAAVMTYGDTLGWAPPVDAAAPALDGDAPLSHGALGARLAAAAGPAERALLDVPDRRVDADGLLAVLDVLAADGSVVLVDPGLSAALAADPARARRLVDTERVTTTGRG